MINFDGKVTPVVVLAELGRVDGALLVSSSLGDLGDPEFGGPLRPDRRCAERPVRGLFGDVYCGWVG